MSKSVKDLDNTQPESFFLTQEALNKTKNFTSLSLPKMFNFISWSLWVDKVGERSVRSYTEFRIWTYSKLVCITCLFFFWNQKERKKRKKLAGPLGSCANIIVCKPHGSLKKQWHDILRGKRKNLPVQRAVIFTQGDFWTARSLFRRAPKTSGKEQMFSLLLMQNRWERLFKTFWGAGEGEEGIAIEDWNTLPFFSLTVNQNIYRAMPPWNINERSVRCARA